MNNLHFLYTTRSLISVEQKQTGGNRVWILLLPSLIEIFIIKLQLDNNYFYWTKNESILRGTKHLSIYYWINVVIWIQDQRWNDFIGSKPSRDINIKGHKWVTDVVFDRQYNNISRPESTQCSLKWLTMNSPYREIICIVQASALPSSSPYIRATISRVPSITSRGMVYPEGIVTHAPPC